MTVGVDVSIGSGVYYWQGLDIIGGFRKSISFSSFAGCWDMSAFLITVIFCGDSVELYRF